MKKRFSAAVLAFALLFTFPFARQGYAASAQNDLTAVDQSENHDDIRITQDIRKAVMGDDGLSFTAKNAKIITSNGRVTLKGPVKNEAEKAGIGAAAEKIAGPGRVDNELEIQSE